MLRLAQAMPSAATGEMGCAFVLLNSGCAFDVAEMRRRGPGRAGRLTVVEVPGCGHAPALNVPAQFELVGGFFS